VTVRVPAVVKVHDSVDVPEPVTLVGERLHAELFDVKVTIPLNPYWAVTVIVDVPDWLTFGETLVGLAVVVKS
jgi:hypothetical protein